jgi:hypothetical protein
MANITNNLILTRTGREFGPDFMLNVEKGAYLGAATAIINENSSITEVLNIIGYMCNTARADDSTINDNGSLDKSAFGIHQANGTYSANGVGPAAATLYLSTAANPLFELDTVANHATAGGNIAGAVIPQGILKRTVDGADPHAVTQPFDIATLQTRTALMSNCIKQMITILENTRTIFGPKGWTALFQQVKGGGAGSKHAAKHTHRQHRRRYSSKEY